MPRLDRRPRQRLDPDARRAKILDAAGVTFAALPFSEVTIAAIARAADASDALIYRYFGGKEALYGEVVQLAITELAAGQRDALEALPDGVPARDRVRTATVVYLDHIARRPDAWAMPLRQPGSEPTAVAELRADARRADVEHLAGLLRPNQNPRHDFALWGYFGFLDAACLHWVERGCPDDERQPLIDAALGALEGALGDWAA